MNVYSVNNQGSMDNMSSTASSGRSEANAYPIIYHKSYWDELTSILIRLV